jgi:hypothetical protein
VGWSPGSDDGRPERENMEKIVNWLISCGYGEKEAVAEANKMIEANRWDGAEKCSRGYAIEMILESLQ